MISGVCADIAARAAVPVWMPRVAFLIFFALHWFVAVLLYVVLAKTMCARPPAANRVRPLYDGVGDVRARFNALDARLRNLEAATLQEEAALRRAFRDLER
jgi:phage shock protein PspC (stress-responsive transcriptional regulator)